MTFIFNTFLRTLPTVFTDVKGCTHWLWPTCYDQLWSFLSVCCVLNVFIQLIFWTHKLLRSMLWSTIISPFFLLPAILQLSALLQEGVGAFLLYCYLLFSSIVFSKQTHHWHLAALISTSAIYLIGFNEIRKENFVGKLGKSCNELRCLFSDIF